MSHAAWLRFLHLVVAACVAVATGVAGVAGLLSSAGTSPAGQLAAPSPAEQLAEPTRPVGAAPAGLRPAAQPNRFYEAPLFFGGLRAARATTLPAAPARPLAGGLTSHHALAAEVISTLFVALEPAPPATVIIVGPNHPNQGPKVITGRRSWETDFGLVEADQGVIDLLSDRHLAAVNDEILSTEHSVGTLMPYIKYHAPKARVVPLILSRDLPESEVRRLAAAIAPLLGSGTLLIASVDFSHYLTGPEAEARDDETLAAIQGFDLDRLWAMGPDHLDSPQSVAFLMLAMKEAGATGPEVAAHTHSGKLVGSGQVETTSYFTFLYRSAGQ